MIKSKRKKMMKIFKTGTIVVVCVLGVVLMLNVFGLFFNNLKQGGIDSENIVCKHYHLGEYDDESGICKPVENKVYDEIILVVGNTANSQAPSLSDEVKEILQNSMIADANGISNRIKVFSATSRTNNIPLNLSDIKEIRMEKIMEVVNKNIDEINEQIKSAPKSDGVRYLETISYAARNTERNTERNKSTLMVIIGSGLSDNGLLDFSNKEADLLHTKNEEIVSLVDKLEDSKDLRIGTMNGVDIIWTNLGEVAMPQPELSDKEKNNLKDLYEEVLIRMGANILSMDDIKNSDPLDDCGGHTVKITDIEHPTLPKHVFTEEELGFIPNESFFLDKERALDSLIKVKEDAKNGTKIIITGYMASGNCNNMASTELSELRAMAVKNVLTDEFGLTNDMTVVNGGVMEGSECLNGVWNNELAKNKRIVTIAME